MLLICSYSQDGGYLADRAVRTALTAAIRERCNCDFQSSSIDSVEFSCQTTTTHVVYRSLINGTTELHTAPELLTFIDDWLENEGTFRILSFRLRVVPDCPLQIQSFLSAWMVKVPATKLKHSWLCLNQCVTNTPADLRSCIVNNPNFENSTLLAASCPLLLQW